MHISADVQRITLNASFITISGERTEQLDIFCHVAGFMSDFLSFIDVELIRFFHGALQLLDETRRCCVALACRHGDDIPEVSVDYERHRVAAGRQEENKANKNVKEIQVCNHSTVLIFICMKLTVCKFSL